MAEPPAIPPAGVPAGPSGAEPPVPAVPDVGPTPAVAAASPAKPAASGDRVLNVVRKWRVTNVVEAGSWQYETRHRQTLRLRLFVVLALFLGLGGGVVGLTALVKPIRPPYFLPLWITEYESREMPINSQADPDRQAFLDGRYFTNVDENAFASQEQHLLMQEMSLLARRTSGPVVVYLCAFASATCQEDDDASRASDRPDSGDGGTKNGRPGHQLYLYPADTHPDNPSRRLSLIKVLDYLRACPAKQKLLVLDVCRPFSDPRLGVLAFDVPHHVQSVLRDFPDPNRLVLCSCSTGQMSHTCEPLQRTAFGYYFEAGLRGYADGYDGRGEKDGRITVRELARFLEARVDRWAVRNRGTRQTPVLFGDATDFELVALPHAEPHPVPDLPDQPAYPSWLLEGWKARDQWFADETYRTVPRLYRRLEAELFRSEQQWRSGIDPERVRNDFKARFERLTMLLNQSRSLVAVPKPHSLAYYARLKEKADDAYSVQVRELLAQYVEQAKDAKPADLDKLRAKVAGDFLKKNKPRDPFVLASAVVEAAANEPVPTVDKLRFLDQLISDVQPEPRYVETLLLRRLVRLANTLPPEGWPTPIVAQLLEVSRKGQRALVEHRPFPWVGGQIEEALRLRHDGEVALFARGFVSLDEASELLKRADDAFDVLLSHEETIETAMRTLDEALAILPVYTPYLAAADANAPVFLEAATVAEDLWKSTEPPSSLRPLDADAVRLKCAELRQKSGRLRTLLGDLRWPFSAERLAELLAQARQPDASPLVLTNLDDLLRTPILHGEDRAAVWAAAQDLGRRLLEKTLDADRDDDHRGRRTSPQARFDSEAGRYQDRHRIVAVRRTLASRALLELAGLDDERVRALEDAMKPFRLDVDNPAATPWDMGEFNRSIGPVFRQSWVEFLPGLLSTETSSRQKRRLEWIFPPFVAAPTLDEPTSDPAIQVVRRRLESVWRFLGDFARYVSRDNIQSRMDPVVTAFFSEIANDFQRFAALPPEVYLQTSGGSSVERLTNQNPQATLALSVTLVAPPSLEVVTRVRILTADDDWLEVTPNLAQMAKLARSEGGAPIRLCELPIRIRLKPGAEFTRTPRPKGFLVQIQVNGRSFHHPVPLFSLPTPASDRVEAILSADPETPNDSISDLRLRPVGVKQSYFLYVRNSTNRPRNVIVQVRDGTNAILAETKAALKPTEVKKLSFPLAAPPPGATPPPGAPAAPAAPSASKLLPALVGPLQVRVLDADAKDELLDLKQLRVGIASPREYVRVADIVFAPSSPQANGRNRLTAKLRSTVPLTRPPCPVQLVLPPARIPGFISANEGNFKGDVPPDAELMLYANNVLLAEGADEEGFVYLTVDGVERAFIFKTTFARSGDPTTPREDVHPAIRIAADRVALSSPNYKVRVETDNPPPDAKIVLSVHPLIEGEPDVVRTVPFAKNRHLGFTPHGDDGALVFEASIQDVVIGLDASGIRGKRRLDVELLDSRDRQIATSHLEVVFDDNGPEQVRFVDLPAAAKRELPIVAKATGADPDTGIAKVQFFFGKPDNGKPPKDVQPVEAKRSPDDRTLWIAPMAFPPDKRPEVDLTVEFVNGVGLSTFKTASLQLVDGEPKPGPGKIVGKVLEGGRPQAGLEVKLEEKKPDDKTPVPPKPGEDNKPKIFKTKDDGSFEFADLKPGPYVLTTSKQESNRQATATVEVPPGKTVTQNLELFR